MDVNSIDSELAKEVFAKPDEYPSLYKMLRGFAEDALFRFKPRPNSIEDHDEQEAFVNATDKFSILLGGTGAGKTEAAAVKTARYLLTTPAPRKDTPFWVIGETYEMVCSVCWTEKLSRFIPRYAIKSIDWLSQIRGWPHAVILQDTHGTGTNWVIEFKSYEQGRAKFQARSIGGYWFNEEVPMSIVEEVQGRCREYDSPGWADFTPIEVKSPEWPEYYDNPPEGWQFYHVNTLKNTALAEGWAERYLSRIPEDLRETRTIGVFASYRGQVYKEWNKQIHVIEPFNIPDDWRKFRGIDFGFNNPFCCLWMAKDSDDRYYIYDEHFANEQTIQWHAAKINQRPWPSRPCYGTTWSDHDAQVRRELQEYGINCTPAKKDVMAGIELIRELLMKRADGKPRLFVFDTCENLIREFRNYHWPEAVGTGNRMKNPNDLPVPYDDHALDAMRYGIFSEDSTVTEFQGKITHQKKPWQLEGARIGW